MGQMVDLEEQEEMVETQLMAQMEVLVALWQLLWPKKIWISYCLSGQYSFKVEKEEELEPMEWEVMVAKED